MRNVRIAPIAINQVPLDWEGNKERIKKALEQADRQGVQLLCFPELCISGYGCEDAFYSPFVVEESLRVLFSLLEFTNNKVVTLGLPLLFKGTLFNTIAVVANKRIIGIVPKKILASDGVYYENRWFKPWGAGVHDTIDLLDPNSGKTFKTSIGDFYFDFGGVKIGLEICEEAWVAQRVGASLPAKGVEIVLNPSASHFAFGKQEIRKRFVTEGSRAFGVAYVFANLLGNEAGRIIFDGAGLVASNGEMLFQGKRFSYNDFEIFDCVVDLDDNKVRRMQMASYKPGVGKEQEVPLQTDFSWNFLKPERNDNKVNVKSSWESSSEIKNEEFYKAVTLGLFDYLRKSKSNGFVISLSGGVDSSVVTVLASLSLKQALCELGDQKFIDKLSYRKDINQILQEKDWLKEFVYVAYQKTQNSSLDTENAAKVLATELKVSYYNWSLDSVLDQYIKTIEKIEGRTLTWSNDDLSLQNIQARIRSPGIWFLANLKKGLLLATSNRSEAAVGYATMDGDTSGGLSPIAGVDKAFLNQWIRWCATKGPQETGPISSLQEVYKRPPTAELRPASYKQEDEKDLMPYDVLDKIERKFIHGRKSPKDIVLELNIELSD
ncbi:MAG: NAD(+) synthase, partial [Bdellovibrionales bacterium]|nr:NAD(+) synthase [Bdellovibrionales bacterium]